MTDRDLWHILAEQVPEDPIEFTAAYLLVQARQAHHAPIWVRGSAGGPRGLCDPTHRATETWAKDSGTRPHHKAAGSSWQRENTKPSHHAAPRAKQWGDALSRATLQQRVADLCALPWQRVVVVPDADAAVSLARRGDVVYLDPPYLHAKVRYARKGLPTEDLEALAMRPAEKGAVVGISEGYPLPGLVRLGWLVEDITRHFRGRRSPGAEWLTRFDPCWWDGRQATIWSLVGREGWRAAA
ncbi:MAG TPA: hypothetical protein VEI97_14560 [bacterium]|nr:hypothetical protein [bacterium]